MTGVAVWFLTPQLTATWRLATMAPEALQAREASRYFRRCDEARAAGVAPMRRGEPGYREGLDGDGDGIACEPYP